MVTFDICRVAKKLGNERTRDALLYLERIMRNCCIKSRVASWRHSRTRSYARVYKYLLTNTHSRARHLEYARRVKRFNERPALRLINFAGLPCTRVHH